MSKKSNNDAQGAKNILADLLNEAKQHAESMATRGAGVGGNSLGLTPENFTKYFDIPANRITKYERKKIRDKREQLQNDFIREINLKNDKGIEAAKKAYLHFIGVVYYGSEVATVEQCQTKFICGANSGETTIKASNLIFNLLVNL